MIFLTLGFFLIALLYSAAGFGGGSSYLALLVLFGWKSQSIAMLALACNLVVTAQGTWILAKNGYLKAKFILPFVSASIPMALVGGLYQVNTDRWFLILGLCLLVSGIFLALPKNGEGQALQFVNMKKLWLLGIGLGSTLGFLAGMVGIGGGILLSPLLHFLKMGKAKEIAGLATCFIFLNSISGLVGQVYKSGIPQEYSSASVLLAAVLVGGNLGSRLTIRVFSNTVLRYWTAALVIVAGLRILWKFI